MRVRDLVPGEKCGPGIFIGRIDPHPLYRSLSLVIWWIPDERRYSLDALHVDYILPDPVVSGSQAGLQLNLRTAILKAQQLQR